MEFYTVLVVYDLSSCNEWETKVFQDLDNAKKYAERAWSRYLDLIDNDLNEEDSRIEEFEYVGSSNNGEDFVSIEIEKQTFSD